MNNIPVTAEDLYLYAMDLLDPAEGERIQEFLPRSPEAQAELASVRGDLALFAFGTEPQEVPAAARQRLMMQVAREARTVTAAESSHAALPCSESAIDATNSSAVIAAAAAQRDTYTPSTVSVPVTPIDAPHRQYVQEGEPRKGFLFLVAPWAGWAVAAGLAVSTFTYYQRNKTMSDVVATANANAAEAAEAAARAAATSARAQTVLETLRSGSSQRFVLTRAASAPIPSARVTYLASNGSLVFEGSNMDAPPPDKTYELWLIPKGEGAKPIPAGTFKPDARGFASVILPELPKGMVAGAFGITMEEAGGSKVPTLPILMAGTA